MGDDQPIHGAEKGVHECILPRKSQESNGGGHELQQKHTSTHAIPNGNPLQKQTKNTYATHDPAFPYLLSFFLLLTSLAWSLAYAHASPANILRIAFFFVFVHCLLASLAVATVMYFAVPRLLGPRGLLAGRMLGRRRRGLFAAAEAGGVGEEGLEFGYCFDVSQGGVRLFGSYKEFGSS